MSAENGAHLAAHLASRLTRPQAQEALGLAVGGAPPERDLAEDVQIDEQAELDPDGDGRRQLEQLRRGEHAAEEHELGRFGGHGADARDLCGGSPHVGRGQLAFRTQRDESVAGERQDDVVLGVGRLSGGGERELGSVARRL